MAQANGIFIAGSDTGVGKTEFICKLIQHLEHHNIPISPRKPIESACVTNENGALIAQDALRIVASSQNGLSMDEVCPYRLSAVASTARAAQLQDIHIDLEQLVAACQTDDQRHPIVEGAGGLLSPLIGRHLNIDLAKALGLSLIVVVEDKLGCINQSLLVATAARQWDVEILAIILNQMPQSSSTPDDTDNLAELKALTDVPVCRFAEINQADSELSERIRAFLST